jgi:hypothetical protein
MDRRARAIILAFADAHRLRGDIMRMELTNGVNTLGKQFIRIRIFLGEQFIIDSIIDDIGINIYYDDLNVPPQDRYITMHSDGIKALLKRMNVSIGTSITLCCASTPGMKICISSVITISDHYQYRTYISERMCLEIFDAILLNMQVTIKPLTGTDNPGSPLWSH